jgi:hypothetical protein
MVQSRVIRLTQDTTAPIVIVCKRVLCVCGVFEKGVPKRTLLDERYLLFLRICEECGKGLMINVVRRETAGALISQDCTALGATMISHTPGFFFIPNIRKAGNLISLATKASDGTNHDAMGAIGHFFQALLSIWK